MAIGAVGLWDPWSDLAALQRDVNQLFARGFDTPERSRATASAMDATRTDEGVCVRMELPGVRPDALDVTVHNDQLVVRGERRIEGRIEEGSQVRHERSYGRFQLALTLPQCIDVDQIKATFENGVLQLDLPKPPERQPRNIKITSTA